MLDINKLNEELDRILEEEINVSQINTLTLQEKFFTKLNFLKYKQEVLKRYEYKKARQNLLKTDTKKAWELYPKLKYENTCWCYSSKNFIITNNCIEHVTKNHNNMTDVLWQEFLNSCNPLTDEKVKAKYDGRYGQRWIYKCQSKTNYFGYVLDIFERSEPQVVTVFTDHENSVNNWIQNAVNKKSKEYKT
jgi:hypothetical protein